MTGKLFIDATIARAGVQKYSDGITEWYEFRPPDEVERSADSFSDCFVTIEHPIEAVTIANSRSLGVGWSRDCVYADCLLETPLVISDGQAVLKAHTTHTEISCGYDAVVTDESGIWVDTDGIAGPKGTSYKYDKVQRNIRGNHIALVRNGTARAGPIARVKLDSLPSQDFAWAIAEVDNEQSQRSDMKTITIQGKQYQVEDAIYDSYQALSVAAKADSATPTQIQPQIDATVSKILDSVMGQIPVLQGKLELANAQIQQLTNQTSQKTDAQKMEEQLRARLDAYTKFVQIVGQQVPFDVSKTADFWQRSALSAMAPGAKLDSLDANGIAQLFDYQLSMMQAQRPQHTDAVTTTIQQQQNVGANYVALNHPARKEDAQIQDWQAQRQAYIDAQTEAVHKPTAGSSKYGFNDSGELITVSR